MPLTRREFLKSAGVAAGGIGLSTAGYFHLTPYLRQPDDIVPGVSTWYATSCRECPAGCSMVVRNRDSRVVKCEGNPASPMNQGRLCARGQAALHGLYDPDRVAAPMRRSRSGKLARVSWRTAVRTLGEQLARRPRIALISDLQTGSLDALMRAWLAAFGSDRLVYYEAISYEAVKAVSGGVVPTFKIAESDLLISFAADFLETWISPVESAREFAEMRQVRGGQRGRFVYVGPRVSMTAANADRRLIVPPGGEEAVAKMIASEPEIGRWLAKSNAPLALPGLDISSARAAAYLNGVLGSRLVDPGRPHALSGTASAHEMDELVADMENGRIDVLVVHGANPAYALPDSARFVRAMKRVGMVVSLSSFMDETSAWADWLLPSSTPLESWGDYSPYPGVANLMQPTMGLLFDTRQAGDTLIDLARAAGIDAAKVFKASSFYEYLRARWGFPLALGQRPEDVSPAWESVVQSGGRWVTDRARSPIAPGTESPGSPIPRFAAGPGVRGRKPQDSVSGWIGYPARSKPLLAKEGFGEVDSLRLWAFPHSYLYDGRGANRRWLQEIPEPVTNGVWGTWAEMHPRTAERLGIATDDLIELASGDAKIEVPAYVWDGVAPGTVAVPIGQGHTDYGRFASGVGANVLPLLAGGDGTATVRRTGKGKWAARIKGDSGQHGREIVQTAALGEPFKRERQIIMPLPSGYKHNDFYPGHKYAKHRWAMVVDLDRCIGCHACVTACYAENNLAVVGPTEIWRRREMSWLRIDRYIDWNDASTPILFQPMLCQHCDAAPCEPVCPVYASSHSEEGLNMQVYNRCVGTRYCSHNCPYKVRRFNWYDFEWPPPLEYQLNPDVTVRCRGVMEKCTFCIQRIREAEILASTQNRPISDGQITPACVQTCPTAALIFGDLKDRGSRVARLIRRDPRAYQVLAELNTKPAVIYLKRIVDMA